MHNKQHTAPSFVHSWDLGFRNGEYSELPEPSSGADQGKQ